MTSSIHAIELELDKINLKRRRNSKKPLTIKTFLSFANKYKILVRARVLEPKQIKPSSLDDSAFENFLRNLHLVDSDEIKGAEVEVNCGDIKHTAITNDEGFIEEVIKIKAELAERQDCSLTLVAALQQRQLKESYAVPYIFPKNAGFAVISDIDDTIIQTGVHNLFKMARQILFGNAHSRLLFDGVVEFYQALHQNKNPIFYVSNSPWNLYDIIAECFKLNNMPVGPIILRDWGVDAHSLTPSNKSKNKIYEIKRIFEFYPELKFILIGDSGQRDPEIYSKIVNYYPGKVLAVYLRDVSNNKRDIEIEALAKQLQEKGIDFVFSADTAAFYRHAKSEGLC